MQMCLRGPFISALNKTWCPEHFLCSNPSCGVNLENIGFVEENGQLYCENDYEAYFAPKCAKCSVPIVGVSLGYDQRPTIAPCSISFDPIDC